MSRPNELKLRIRGKKGQSAFPMIAAAMIHRLRRG
jgi:hypothetical protein